MQWRLTRLRGEFCITWDEPNGIRRRYRLGTSDPKEAHRRATSRYAELTRPIGKTVADIWTGYVKDREGRAIIETMKYTWRAMQARFGSIDAEAVTVDDCRAHVKERREKGIQDGTIYTELGHLRMVLKWAENIGTIARAPHIERPSKPEPMDNYLTQAEIERLIECANVPHIALAIRLMVSTGARNAAALELTWDRVDFDRRLVTLRNPFDRARRKGRATVPMNDTLYGALKEAHEAAMTPFVIEWAGRSVKSIRRGLSAAAEAAGLEDVTPHVLRHSTAVILAESGHSMDEIAQFLGHGDSKITAKVYAKFSPGHLRGLADSLG